MGINTKFIWLGLLVGLLSVPLSEAKRIVYVYDSVDRLQEVNYSNEAVFRFGYDAAHNLDVYSVLTAEDEAFFKAFWLYFSQTGEFFPYVCWLTSDTFSGSCAVM